MDTPAVDAPADAPVVDSGVDAPPTDVPPTDTPPVDDAPDAPADVAPDVPPADVPPGDVPPACGPGEAMCGGRCTNVISNPMNCGACGRVCDAARACQLGGCQVTNTTHYRRVAVSETDVRFFNACAGGTRVLPSMDDASVLVPLPFAFSLFGASVAANSMVNVSTNGFMSLAAVMNASFSGSIPNAAAPNAVIAPYWTDLLTRMGGVCYETRAETGLPRQFIVMWQGAAFFNATMGAGDLTFEVILTEGTNTIDFAYQFLSDTPRLEGRTLTIGVENAAGSEAFAVCNESLLNCGIATGSRVRLVPVP